MTQPKPKPLKLYFGRTWESWVLFYIAAIAFQVTIPGGDTFPWWLIIAVLCAIFTPSKITWHGREREED